MRAAVRSRRLHGLKAIKHITAGLLHYEVLGKIPERDGRHRAGRGKPTSAAQAFYNLKCSWQELELILAANFGSRDYVLTLTYDDEHLPADKEAAAACFQKFIRKLRDTRRKREEITKYVYVIEGFHGRGADPMYADGELEDRRLHHHAVLNRAGESDLEEIRSLWPYGGYIRLEPVDVHYYRELAKYLTKEAREFGRGKVGERTWRGSRNLTKYDVEYIEIPSDSITLAAPAGAVDYQVFSERNPYGYADSMGARYLLFPEPERTDYSYNMGRSPSRSA